MNYVALKGRLVRDPEMRKTKSDTSCVTFTLAVDRDFKDKNGERQADFINCVAWRGTADFIEKFFIKGQEMCVSEGTIQTRKFEDKEGNTRTATEVIVNKVEFCGGREGGQSQKSESKPRRESSRDDDEDLPF